MHDLHPSHLSQALADSSRLSLLALLCTDAPLCVCELGYALELPQPRVSQHLARLRTLGLVRHTRHANRHYYALAPGLPAWIGAVVDGHRAGLEAAGTLERPRARLATMPHRPQAPSQPRRVP